MTLLFATSSYSWILCLKLFGVMCCCKTGANVSGPPPLEDKRPHWGNPQSCLLHMSSRTQHTGGIHKAVSCICNSNIQGCGTLGGLQPCADDLNIFPATSRTRHTGGSTPCADDLNIFPPSPHVLEFTENSCNVICTNKYPYMLISFEMSQCAW